MEDENPPLKLTGLNGNVFVLLGAAKKVAREHGMEWDEIYAEATSGDYDGALRTLMKHFDVS